MDDTFQLVSEAPPPRPQKKPGNKRVREKKETKDQAAAAAFYAHITPPATRGELTFRHGFWEIKRAKIIAQMEAMNTNIFKMERFKNCGSEAQVCWSEKKQKYRIRANYCHDRHCEPCMRSKANRIAVNLTTRLELKAKGRYRLITLTLAHTATPLVDQVKRLYKCFRQLRQSKTWKSTQIGGAFMLEVKLATKRPEQNYSIDPAAPAPINTARPLWHPHLHIASEGQWINAQELSREWKRITEDSYIVDVRAINNGRDAANYVAKYVTKSTSANVWDDPEATQEWMTAAKGTRTCGTFGTWRGWALTQAVDNTDDWQPVCRLQNLIDRCRTGEVHAITVIQILRPPWSVECDDPAR